MESDQGDPDTRIYLRVRKGDDRASAILVDRLLPPVLALAERMLADRAEAEDTAHEAFERLWKGGWKPGRARLSTWLYTVTLNLCRDRLRRRKRFAHDDEGLDMIADTGAGPAANMISGQACDAVRDGLQRLPETQRAALVLRHYHDMSTRQIASCLSISVRAAESLLARALRSMRKHMEASHQ